MNYIKKLSFAKINLGLQVLNKRPDGFHNINTVFFLTKLADVLTFQKIEANEIQIKTSIDLGIEPEQNLVYRAIEKYQKKFPIDFGLEISIEKNIPMGGGLGGGSSNAAIALNAVNELNDSKATYSDLLIIAQSLGSDIPYFLHYGTALAQSRGEKLDYFDFDLPYSVVLINPNIHISTPWAYTKLERNENERKQLNFPLLLTKSLENPSLLKEFIINDFEEVVFAEYPQIAEIKDKLYKMGADLTLLSGSGASVFGLFPKDYDKVKIKSTFQDYFIYCE